MEVVKSRLCICMNMQLYDDAGRKMLWVARKSTSDQVEQKQWHYS